jgi:hypothetical protein
MNGKNCMMKSFMILFCLVYVIRQMEVSRTVWMGCVAYICEMRNADNILATHHGALRQRHKLDCSVMMEVVKEQSVTMWTEFT